VTLGSFVHASRWLAVSRPVRSRKTSPCRVRPLPLSILKILPLISPRRLLVVSPRSSPVRLCLPPPSHRQWSLVRGPSQCAGPARPPPGRPPEQPLRPPRRPAATQGQPRQATALPHCHSLELTDCSSSKEHRCQTTVSRPSAFCSRRDGTRCAELQLCTLHACAAGLVLQGMRAWGSCCLRPFLRQQGTLSTASV
jgi:hypothetical protein